MLKTALSRVSVLFLLLGFICFANASFCQESLKSPSYTYDINKVAILPFADYSHQGSFDAALKWGGNRRVIEYIKNEFAARQVEVTDQDKVVGLLLRQGAIKRLKDVDRFGTPEYELMHSTHWEQLTKELFVKIAKKQDKTSQISKQEIIQIGKDLGVDTIIRGTILHYEITPSTVENTFEDMIPFLFISGDKTLPYYAFGPEYEKDIFDRNKITAAHNYDLVFPLHKKSSGIVVVMYVQDAKTGDILWKDSQEVPYPDSDFNAKLSKKISDSFEKLFRLNNYGYLYIK